MWRALNSALGNEKVENLTFQLQKGERIISEPKAVAFFISKDPWKKYESAVQTDDENLCELHCVSSKVVSKILHSLKVNKAAGLDKIPARLVRDVDAELTPSITYLINKSITDATVPALRKVARVTPLYKAEDKLLVENYRPISVLPVLSKVLERVIHTQTSAYLDHLGWLYKQYGFRGGRSTAQAMGQLNNSVLDAMDGGEVAGMLFLGMSKAFDSINHKILLGKLEHIGLAARSLRWFKSYLADRRQCVCINGEVSETRPIDLGVPQRSILGPLLFNVYINSLSAAVTESDLILYADDAVLIVAASTPQELNDALRHDFTLISDWYTNNKLTLNVKKTKLMLSGSN